MMKICKLYIRQSVFLVFLLLFTNDFASAQIVLERISVTERDDEYGYVVRYHFSEPVDSFRIVQPEMNKIQMVLYSGGMQTTHFRPPDDNSVIEDIRIIDLNFATGFEFILQEDQTLSSVAYRDANQTDLLLSLVQSNREELQNLVSANESLFGAYEPGMERPQDAAEFSREDSRLASQDVQAEPHTLHDFLHTRNPNTLNRILPGDPMELYLRAVYPYSGREKASSFLHRPVHIQKREGQEPAGVHPWMDHTAFTPQSVNESSFGFQIYAPRVYTSNNSAIPMGQNDGILWQGRGNNYFITGGAGVQYGPFTAVFRPQFAYSENLEFTVENTDPSTKPDFDVSMYPRFADSGFQMHLIYADIPWRFGEESLSEFDLGDSFIQVEYGGFAAGFSNERIWTGPAIHNSLIFSNHAPGFLHGFIGTNEPWSTSWGDLEARWLWGGVRESDFFDDNPSNDLRHVTALSMNYSPSAVPGLHVGFTRAAYSYHTNGLSLSDVFLVFRPSQSSNITDPADAYFHMMSVYSRWVFPKINFEIYAEWGRNDHKRTLRDVLSEPELNRGYVLGFIKSFEITPSKRLLLNTEITDLENSSVTATSRDFNIWYTNETIGQGFTHRGQVLGAGIGPGSSTQQMHLQYYDTWGMIGVSASRIAHHMDRHFKYEDYFRSQLARWPQFYFLLDRHEIEIRYGFDLLLFLPYNFELQAGYRIGKVENRFNLRGVDVDNYQYSFTLRYNLGGFSR